MTADSTAILKELQELNTRLSGLTLEMADVRETLNIHCKRMTELQAELDVLPALRRRRERMRASAPRPMHSGNGR